MQVECFCENWVFLVIHTFFVFIFVIILLRLSGKKQMGQMGPTEFVAILLISNAVQNSINAGDNSLVGGLVCATILIAVSGVISYLNFRSSLMRKIFEGTPRLLVRQGKVVSESLHKERLSLSDLKILLRKQGIHNIHEIDHAILESDGSLSVTKIGDTHIT